MNIKLFFVAIFLSFSFNNANAGSLSDKLFEAFDSAKGMTQQAREESSKAYRDAKDKITESYEDYRHRKSMEAEREKTEKERVNKAVEYYEKQMQKKDTPKVTIKYADPCSSANASCNTDLSGRKWCWFPGSSKTLCGPPIQESLTNNVTRNNPQISLRKSLNKKRDECRKKVYEDWAKKGGGNQEFSSFTLINALKACD